MDNVFSEEQWWLDMNMYQIFVRSFNDSNGDGVGDIPGITEKLEYIASLGINCIWLTPFYPSPQADMGYDVSNYVDVDPLFGTLDDFDAMVTKAHSLGLKVVIDIVPNHTSDEHPWFQAALKAEPGSKERDRYIFADGLDDGASPPNKWDGWTTESPWEKVDTQWYLHLFSTKQPDLNWRNEEVREEFRNILRFWLNRGIDGIRVDAPTTLIKPLLDAAELDNNLPELFPIYADWKEFISQEYGPRLIVGEVFDSAENAMDMYIDQGHMDQTFCFDYQSSAWTAAAYQDVISSWVDIPKEHGSTAVWVSSTHDLMRMASYLGYEEPDGKNSGIQADEPQPDFELGQRRVRALTLMTMCLPGAIVTYYGEELGLPDNTLLTREILGRWFDRDGCRSPMPWSSTEKNLGFSTADAPWVPQPETYKSLAVDVEQEIESSLLRMYKELFRMRVEYRLASNEDFHILPSTWNTLLKLRSGNVCCAINFGTEPVPMPEGEIIAKSLSTITKGDDLPANSAVWLYQDWAIKS